VLRVAPEEEGGADQTARGPGRPQVHRQGLHRYAPETEGELEEVL